MLFTHEFLRIGYLSSNVCVYMIIISYFFMLLISASMFIYLMLAQNLNISDSAFYDFFFLATAKVKMHLYLFYLVENVTTDHN